MAQPFMPFIAQMFQHSHVTCDGCGAIPIKGPRFKCQSCANFDLCAECYAEKKNIKDGQCVDHHFDCILVDCAGAFPCMSKGKGKGKGKHFSFNVPYDPLAWASTMGPMEGFFEGLCKGTRSKGVQDETQNADTVAKTMCFPVEVADGRSLQIQWTRGEDPTRVASAFAQEHGIREDELASIVQFVCHAEEVTLATATSKEPKREEPQKEAKTSGQEEEEQEEEAKEEVEA